MKQESSYGIVPLRRTEKGWEILLIQHHSGHWSFPKGHANPGESPQETAARELLEETSLFIEAFLTHTPMTESYCFTFHGERIYKTVHYFLALVKGQVKIQELEIRASQWLPASAAANYVTFKEGKRLCQQTIDFLRKLSGNPANEQSINS